MSSSFTEAFLLYWKNISSSSLKKHRFVLLHDEPRILLGPWRGLIFFIEEAINFFFICSPFSASNGESIYGYLSRDPPAIFGTIFSNCAGYTERSRGTGGVRGKIEKVRRQQRTRTCVIEHAGPYEKHTQGYVCSLSSRMLKIYMVIDIKKKNFLTKKVRRPMAKTRKSSVAPAKPLTDEQRDQGARVEIPKITSGRTDLVRMAVKRHSGDRKIVSKQTLNSSSSRVKRARLGRGRSKSEIIWCFVEPLGRLSVSAFLLSLLLLVNK